MNIFGSIKALIWFFVMLVVVFIVNGMFQNFVLSLFTGIELIIVQVIMFFAYAFLVIGIPYLVAISD